MGRERRFARRSLLTAALVACSVAMAGCGGDAGGGDDTFDVLFIGGTTGPYGTNGKATVRALEAAAEYINESGGVGGKKIKLEVKDNQGDPTKSVSLLQESLSGGKPDLMIPSATSPEALAMLPLITRNKIVTVGFPASPLIDDPKQYPYHFQGVASSERQLNGLKARLERSNVKRLGILASEDEYGKGVVEAVKRQLKGAPIDVNVVTYSPGDVDLRVPYERMLDGDPDFVYLDTTGESAVRLLQAREQADATDIPTIAGSGMSMTAGGPHKYGSEAANKNLEILVFSVEVAQPESEQSEVFKQFMKRYAKGQPVQTSLSTPALAWDQLRLGAAAAEVEGAFDDYPDSYVQAFYKLDVPEGHWLTAKKFEFEAGRHSLVPALEDFPFIPSSPMVNGQYQVKEK
ncbi:ABC transporter substrate-binding protein [Actinomadura livida]|uniref:Branched-chain amino acid transport system substrate-binding protein n=1 Tax=Actinomadura livida TaxID=79909 RepID=A0A7W7MZI6_9ACTN|nr:MULTISPECIES: ABC transporter substrate-binding protein [Actinomadura]MBB4775942.1 branched-chain amino acid transport system substrate-binding protein [Actinomadura catellatispora]GGU16611.1 hypothetical protein GCM10010208_47250 [Actinomadura livida]